MRRVVVTGATSMLGTALIEVCIRENIEILAIVRENSLRLKRLPQSDLVKVMECPLEHLDKLYDFAEHCKRYDVFYHFAWDYAGKQYRDNPTLQEMNIKSTLDAVKLAQKLGCKKFIGAGSQAEYGYVEGIIDEKTPVSPNSAYGIAKYAAGRLSGKLCEEYEITHIWARIFSVYGKNDNEGTMINYAIDQFLNNEKAVFTAGTQMWDYLFEKDAGVIFYKLGMNVCENKVFRIASGKSMPLKWYIEEIRNGIGWLTECEYENKENSPLLGFQVNTEDLEKLINYKAEISFTEGIKDVVEYRKKLKSKK